MQSARHLVVRGVELAACVQLRQHHLHSRHHLPVAHRHHVHRNAAAVIGHRDRVVHVDRDFNPLGVAGQRLVHRVVHHLVYQVMQTHLAGRADVHGRPQAHCLKTFEDLDVLACVVAVVAVLFGKRIFGCLGRHRIPFAGFSLRTAQARQKRASFRMPHKGNNRLKKRGLGANSPNAILPCGPQVTTGTWSPAYRVPLSVLLVCYVTLVPKTLETYGTI